MKLTKHKNQIWIFAIAILIAGHGFAQDDCKVNLESIAGSYEGGCKKGLAEGQGTAKGEDTYVGDFKKGYPHGTGTYTWASGDVYTGEFKKGLKEGEGKLTVNLGGDQKKEQKGYWVNDKYIGESEHPYEILSRSPEILSIRINETENPTNDGNAIFITILHKGRNQQSPRFGLSVNSGSIQNQFLVGNKTKVLVSKFPLGISINYMGEVLELMFSQETSWNVSIDYNK